MGYLLSARQYIQCVDDTRNVTQDCEQDVDAEIGTATPFQQDTDGREEDGKNDLADITGDWRYQGQQSAAGSV